ncbi:MAG: nucleoside deaminase [Saprospiraceae bacterium]|nr:nucleoside deaminase [Saprospiraceae bacterium]
MFTILSDDHFMKEALKEARKAEDQGDIPVGAVVVSHGRIIARAHNQTELLTDVTAHAEILAITSASSFLQSKYLDECTLYVTMEPCVMCAGALRWAQLSRVVYGAADDKRGFMRYGKQLLHPKTKLEYGVLEAECSEIVKRFFEKLRVE